MNLLQDILANPAEGSSAIWPANPVIYEINTWVWLRRLSSKYQRRITLANVPASELAELAAWGFDAVWLMGVWHRGQATRLSALNYLHEYRQALPDVTDADVPGSAYAIRDYQVERELGGREGLAVFREALRRLGIKLILDFVPNHVATDHRWTREHPEYFICGAAEDLERQPSDYFVAGAADGKGAVIARGRDPYFPAWIDTAQLNAFQPGLRQAAVATLIDIGDQCDGVRCDMAMLMLNAVFANTWNRDAEGLPPREYWQEVIPAARAAHPQMLFMAEVYWDLEHELLRQGFDYTYDKRLYDRLANGAIGEIKSHLRADLDFLRSNIRFIENHDERRAMEVFGADRQRPAAALICTLPGAALLHQGQLSGRRIKLPVQISRGAEENSHPLLARFYRRLLNEVRSEVYRAGAWQLREAQAIHSGDHTQANLIAYTWEFGETTRLVIINLSSEWSRARLDLSDWRRLAGLRWRLCDLLSESFVFQDGDSILLEGLLLEAPPSSVQILRFDADAAPKP